jgi:2-C-methyl-D-erythritol 4-phosphate cytidylyltransferase
MLPLQSPVWTIVVAGGSGTRFGTAKQYEQLGELRVLDRSVATARACTDGVVVVVPAVDVTGERTRFEVVVAGGATRSESVRAGLAAVPDDVAIVCVHDACRPLADASLFAAVVDAVRDGADGAVPGVAVNDTIKLVDEHGRVHSTPPRDRLFAVQTPQAFRAAALRGAHAAGGDATDDAALVESSGGVVVVVPGQSQARKITHRDDLEWARRQMAQHPGGKA